MPITLDGSLGITTPTYNGNTTAEYLVPVTGFKNRFINGGMTIDPAFRDEVLLLALSLYPCSLPPFRLD